MLKDLAGMVPRFQVEHYAITEYVNDVNRENAEVLMELKVDGRGSVTGLANAQGKVTDIYRYDAFGQLTYGMPDTTNFYGYNGELTNTNTGFQYLRARYYNPENGNFTTEDTYGGTLREPLTQNRYTYVSNNPLNYTDSTGHSLLSRIGNGIKKSSRIPYKRSTKTRRRQ